MANNYIDMDTMRFTLYEVHQMQGLLGKGRFKDYDQTSIDIFLDSIKDFSDKDLFPTIKEMDEKPCRYDDGKIYVHPRFESIVKTLGDMGFVGASFSYEDGGMQLPMTVLNAAYYIMEAANNHVSGYPGLTTGAANLILTFGNQELKETYTPNMLKMKWAGTMCLTEPQAGSSLSDVVASASPRPKGGYVIEGQKIFISSGDYQYVDNFVHLVLARVVGAPSGTKGISLFVVPKYLPQGTELVDNHVATLGEFEKLGQRGYATAHIGFSDGGDSIGYLVGEENQGLKYMFQMMNEARIATGRMAAGIACAAYHASLEYAKERPQGRKLTASGSKNADEPQTEIINHPDVKRMLLLQKAVVEGSLSLITEASIYVDKSELGEAEEKKKYHLLLELLTPVVKTYPSEMGKHSVDTGLQVLGGYGFTMDFILQQYYRDIRITSIYEGTTGIQSLDLLGRKVLLDDGRALKLLVQEIQQTVDKCQTFDSLSTYAEQLMQSVGVVQGVLTHLVPIALAGDHERFLADATIFMEMFGKVILGWQWLKISATAAKALEEGDAKKSIDFYNSKVHTMQFYFKYEMTQVKGLAHIIKDNRDLTLDQVPHSYF